MEEKIKRPPGRPRKYAEGKDGAPFLGLRLEPDIYDYVRERSEGPRAYIQRLIADDRHLHGGLDGNSADEDHVLNLHYWRVYYKDTDQPVAEISHYGEDKSRLGWVETVNERYDITAEQLQDAEAVITWMCQLDDKSWMTPHCLHEFFKIMRAFDLAHHYF